MIRRIRKLYNNFKEYFIVSILLITCLFIISQNDKPEIRNFKKFAFSEFAYITSVVSSSINFLYDDSELNNLKKLNAELMLKVNRLRELGLENSELRTLLNHLDQTKFDLQPAKIISRLVSKVNGNLILDVGTSDSIFKGMPVINQTGLVGIVTEESEDFCIVKTLENSELNISVKSQRSNIHGVLSWDGMKLLIKAIPTTSDVQKGDRIVTSDFSTILPPSIPVGIVKEKTTNISGVLTNIIIEPFVDFQKIKNLFVAKIIINPKLDEFELNLLK